MKSTLKLLPFLCLSLYSNVAHAYGAAGCGLGSLVFPQNNPGKQILAATTNATGIQTFGITTGTSNCGPGVFTGLQRQKDFMTANLASLQREVAQGSGETVDGLASVLGCSEADYETFGAFAQSRYSNVFNSTEPEKVLGNLKQVIQSNPTLTQSCTLASI